MLRPPTWWLRRLSAMSPPEIAHRLVRALQHPVDRAGFRIGALPPRRPGLAEWKGPLRTYFGDAAVTISPQMLEAADKICDGQRQILGLGWLEVGDDPWHLEPLANATWPRGDSALVRSRAPTLDPRLTWEMNRGHEWVVLARAAASTAEPRYVQRLEAELGSWRRANPIGEGINWVSAMEAAIRIHSLSWVAAFLRHRLPTGVATMLDEHAWFVKRNLSAFSSANNHLIVELTALIVASRDLGTRVHTWARGRLEAELEVQTHSDGVNAEMATHYHLFVFEAVLLAAWVERLHGEPSERLERTLSAMASYITAETCDDGELLDQGDRDDGKIIPFLDSPRRVVGAFEGLISLDPAAILGERLSRAVTAHSLVFRASGQVAFRGPGLLATFDAGPFGFGKLAAHAHCDALAVNASLGGRPFLVDRGTYVYNGDNARRDLFRGTAAHNTLQVGSHEQARSAGPFLWRTTPSVVLEHCELGGTVEVAQGSHDGFAPARHRRTILHRDGVLLIVDELTESPAEGTIRFHFAPDLSVRMTARGALVGERRGARVGSLACSAALELLETTHSSAYRAAVPAITAVGETSGGCAVTVLAERDEIAVTLGQLQSDVRRFSRSAALLFEEMLA